MSEEKDYEILKTVVFSTAHMPEKENREMRQLVRGEVPGCPDTLQDFWDQDRSDEFQDTFSRINMDLEKDLALVQELHWRFPHLVTLLTLGFALGGTSVQIDGSGRVCPWLKVYDW